MVPFRLRSMTVSVSASLNNPSTPSMATPALLMRTSMRPQRSNTCFTKASLSARLLRSAVRNRKRLATVGSLSQVSTSLVFERAHVATRSPVSRKDVTRPAPSPLLPPVTMTTLPAACASAVTDDPSRDLVALGDDLVHELDAPRPRRGHQILAG